MKKGKNSKNECKKWLALLMKLITFLTSFVKNNLKKQL